MAGALYGLEKNDQEGNKWRNQLHGMTDRLTTGVENLGLKTTNNNNFPIVTVTVGKPAQVVQACQILWQEKIIVTPAIFPAAPINEGGIRFTLTYANTIEEVDQAIHALKIVKKEVIENG
jgi:7-keto-8-aminopelargonate synthetase-like enzyme